jgi:hypothetical protein
MSTCTVVFSKPVSLQVAKGCVIEKPKTVFSGDVGGKRICFARRSRERWTPEEDKVLLSGTKSVEEMAKEFGRTYDAIQVRQSALRCGRACNSIDTYFWDFDAKKNRAG